MATKPDTVLIAESVSQRRAEQQLNYAIFFTTIVVVIFIVMAFILNDELIIEESEEISYSEWKQVPLKERYKMDLNLTSWRSQLPESGPYDILPMTEHFVEVDLPASEQDAGYPEDALMHVALWLPDVEEGEKVPVIATVHPYYDFGTEVDDSCLLYTSPSPRDRG